MTIPTRVVIREEVAPTPNAVSAIATSTPVLAIPLAQVLEQLRRKRARSKNEVDFLGINTEEPVKEVLEALSPETTAVAMVHSRYWTEEWGDHTSSYTVEDLVAANGACITWALSTSAQLEGLIKDLRAKNMDLAKRLEESVLYMDTVGRSKPRPQRPRGRG